MLLIVSSTHHVSTPHGQRPAAARKLSSPQNWTVRDNTGHLLSQFVGASQREVGRKIVTGHYDPFRLEVSHSLREVFERDVRQALANHGWQIVPVSPHVATSLSVRGDFTGPIPRPR